MSSASLRQDPPPPALEARGVHVSLQGNEILHGVEIVALPGQVVALMGGNGSGKSTFVRALVGAVPISAGTIDIFGSPASAQTRARMGYVPQRMTASGGVAATALEVVTSGLLGHRVLRPGKGARERAVAAMATLGVDDLAQKDVTHLSGGQQQRVLISRALVRDPQLLILDEPMAGVDLQSQVAFAHALGHLKEAGVAIVIVLHELGALARHIDQAVVIDRGAITHVGAPPQDLGVHALPGHDHEHAHDEQPARTASTLGLEGPQ